MGKIVELDKMQLTIRAKRIYDILDKEKKPLVAVLLATHFIDSSLEKLLRHNFNKSKTTNDLLQPSGVLGSLSAKYKIAFCLNLISKKLHDDIGYIAKIRNRFAHTENPQLNFTNDQISDYCRNLQGPEIFVKQMGGKYKKDLKIPEERFKVGIMMIVEAIIEEIENVDTPT